MSAQPAPTPFDAFERPMAAAAHRPMPIPLAEYRARHQVQMFPPISDRSAQAVNWVMYLLIAAVLAVILVRAAGVI